jgi:hypothetical protein
MCYSHWSDSALLFPGTVTCTGISGLGASATVETFRSSSDLMASRTDSAPFKIFSEPTHVFVERAASRVHFRRELPCAEGRCSKEPETQFKVDQCATVAAEAVAPLCT